MYTPFILLFAVSTALADAPESDPVAPARGPWFVSSSVFMLGNFLPEPPRFVQLNAGYRLNENNALIIEAITWTYPAPLGIPYGPDWGDPKYNFPGHARDIGVGLAFQHFWWKGAYTTGHVTPFRQTYFDQEGERIQAGFQLFCVLRAGYHFSLWKDRLFIEPSVAITSWPVNTKLPPEFAAQESQWRSFFVGEPGLHFGFNF